MCTIDKNFKLSYKNIVPERKLKDYENVQVRNSFNNIDELLSVINTNEHIIVHFINEDSGLGSQLTIFMQNLFFLINIIQI